MRQIIAVLVFLTGSSITMATPYDGIYATQKIEVQGEFADPPLFYIKYLTLQELEDGTVVLLVLHTETKDWQAFAGTPTESGYEFVDVYSFVDYGSKVESEEIVLEFDESGNAQYTHFLIVDEADWVWPQIPYPDDGKKLIVDEPIKKMTAVN